MNDDHRRSDGTVMLIGALKLFKGLLLLLVAVGSLHLLHRDIAETLSPIIAELHIDAGALVYAALLSTEGIGLLLRRRWAEYFTVLVTGSFIPLELYELARRATVTR